jgi:hypothetical protein
MREFQLHLVDHNLLELGKWDIWVARFARRKEGLERVVKGTWVIFIGLKEISQMDEQV